MNATARGADSELVDDSAALAGGRGDGAIGARADEADPLTALFGETAPVLEALNAWAEGDTGPRA